MRNEVLIVAGEASADRHAASLVKELRLSDPGLHFFGVGGKHLREQGLEVVIPAEQLNVVGLTDWFDKLWKVLEGFGALKRQVQLRRPRAAILLDLPDFNLRLAKHLKKLGVPVVYYISPQVWAWRKYRVRAIRNLVDKMLVVFPFEREFYNRLRIPAIFVGHPLLEQVQKRLKYRDTQVIRSSPRVAILPGSRTSELVHHTELVKELCYLLKKKYPQAQLRIPVASTLSFEQVSQRFQGCPVEVVTVDSREVIDWADVAAVASGTATLETALIGTPFTLFYRMSRLTRWAIQYAIRYRGFFCMANLLHGREVVREFLHERATARRVFEECVRLIEDEAYRRKMAQDLHACRVLLGDAGASQRAAKEVSRLLLRVSERGRQLVPSPV